MPEFTITPPLPPPASSSPSRHLPSSSVSPSTFLSSHPLLSSSSPSSEPPSLQSLDQNLLTLISRLDLSYSETSESLDQIIDSVSRSLPRIRQFDLVLLKEMAVGLGEEVEGMGKKMKVVDGEQEEDDDEKGATKTTFQQQQPAQPPNVGPGGKPPLSLRVPSRPASAYPPPSSHPFPPTASSQTPHPHPHSQSYHQHPPQPIPTPLLLSRLRLLSLLKSRLSTTREILREAESWSTLEGEVTGLIAEGGYLKAAERLEEAERGVGMGSGVDVSENAGGLEGLEGIGLEGLGLGGGVSSSHGTGGEKNQTTTAVMAGPTADQSARMSILTSLQNQLEASLSAALVNAASSLSSSTTKISSPDPSQPQQTTREITQSLRSFFDIFQKIDRVGEFKNYYYGCRRQGVLDEWNKASIREEEAVTARGGLGDITEEEGAMSPGTMTPMSSSMISTTSTKTSNQVLSFSAFLPTFLSHLLALLSTESSHHLPYIIPLRYESPSTSLSTLLTTTLTSLQPGWRWRVGETGRDKDKRISVPAEKEPTGRLVEVLKVWREIRDFGIKVEKLMIKAGLEATEHAATTTEKILNNGDDGKQEASLPPTMSTTSSSSSLFPPSTSTPSNLVSSPPSISPNLNPINTSSPAPPPAPSATFRTPQTARRTHFSSSRQSISHYQHRDHHHHHHGAGGSKRLSMSISRPTRSGRTGSISGLSALGIGAAPTTPSGDGSASSGRHVSTTSIVSASGNKPPSLAGTGGGEGQEIQDGQGIPTEWETTLYEPMLGWWTEYATLEKSFFRGVLEERGVGRIKDGLDSIGTTRMPSSAFQQSRASSLPQHQHQQKWDGNKVLSEKSALALNLADEALERCLELTLGFGSLGFLESIDEVIGEWWLSGKAKDVIESERRKARHEGDNRSAGTSGGGRRSWEEERAMEGLEYSSEDWDTFGSALRLLQGCKAVEKRIEAFERRAEGRLKEGFERIARAGMAGSMSGASGTVTVLGVTKGLLTMLRSSELNDERLTEFVDALDRRTSFYPSVSSTTPPPPAAILAKTRAGATELTKSCQLLLHDTILRPLIAHLEGYAALPCWTSTSTSNPSSSATGDSGAPNDFNPLPIPTFSLSSTETMSRVADGLLNLPRLFEVYQTEEDALGWSIGTLPYIGKMMVFSEDSQQDERDKERDGLVPPPSATPMTARRSSGLMSASMREEGSSGGTTGTQPASALKDVFGSTSIPPSPAPPSTSTVYPPPGNAGSGTGSTSQPISTEQALSSWLSSLTLSLLYHITDTVLPNIPASPYNPHTRQTSANASVTQHGMSQLSADLNYLSTVASTLDVEIPEKLELWRQMLESDEEGRRIWSSGEGGEIAFRVAEWKGWTR